MLKHLEKFLTKVQNTHYETNITTRGIQTIQQTMRNKLRREAEQALKEDLLESLEDFDTLQVKDGILLVSHNEDFEFVVQLKVSIPSLDFDPYEEAEIWEEEQAQKAEEKADKEAKKAQKIARDAELRKMAREARTVAKTR